MRVCRHPVNQMWYRRVVKMTLAERSVLRRIGLMLVGLAVAAVAVGCSGFEYSAVVTGEYSSLATGEDSQPYFSDGGQFTNDPAELTILDPTINSFDIHVDGIPYCGVVALTELSDVVFLGRVVGYRQRLYTDPEELDVGNNNFAARDIYEGIVMQAEEVLFGEMPEPNSRITLGAATLEERTDEIYKRLLPNIRWLLPGIEAMANPAKGPLYLVYAAAAQNTPAADHDLYWLRHINGIYSNGTIDLTQRGSIFTTSVCVGSDHGEQVWAERNYKLQDARAAGAYVSSLGERRNDNSEWYSLHEDINEITKDSDIVFVGRIVDYIEQLEVEDMTANNSVTSQLDSEVRLVYSGIVLEVDEVLLGEMPEAESRVTLGASYLQSIYDRDARSLFHDQPTEIFNAGIQSIGSANSPQYLVYATASEAGSRAHELGLYWLNTHAGAVCVNADGTLGIGQESPFDWVWAANEAGDYEWRNPYDLQDARKAAELAKSGIAERAEELGSDAEQAPPIDRLRPNSTHECSVLGATDDS